jgi:hypothetical protein
MQRWFPMSARRAFNDLAVDGSIDHQFRRMDDPPCCCYSAEETGVGAGPIQAGSQPLVDQQTLQFPQTRFALGEQFVSGKKLGSKDLESMTLNL